MRKPTARVVAMALAALCAPVTRGGTVMAEEEPASNRTLKRETERLHEELVQMRRRLERMAGDERLDRPELPGAPDDGTVTDESLRAEMNRLRRDMADLAVTMARASRTARPEPGRSRTLKVEESGTVHEERVESAVLPREVVVRNTGRTTVVNPRVIVNDRGDWSDVDRMLNEALGDARTDREKALAIWRFLVDNRYHDQPAHNDVELHDPVRYLNVYGYGFCDDSATNFMVLAEKAGLKSRVWGLSGHVVPEAWFDGDWHVLDPDGEIYYLDDDGETISSIETLQQRPDIIRKYPSPYYTRTEQVVQLYTTTDDNRVSEWYREKSGASHRMDYVLRPGEAVARSVENRGLYFSSRYLREPKRYGNGQFTFTPIFEPDVLRESAESLEGLAAKDAALVTTSPGGTGSVVFRFESPYPFLAGTVRLRGDVPEGGSASLAFQDDAGDWHRVWTADKVRGRFVEEISTTGYFRNGYDRPMYAYRLRLTLTSPGGGVTKVEAVTVTTEFQHAPHAMPALEKGTNRVRYEDDGAERDVEVEFRFDAGEEL